jgi:hypothetical protein
MAPPSLASSNEAGGTGSTRGVTPTVFPVTSTLTGFNPATGITVPPYSITTLFFSTASSTTATARMAGKFKAQGKPKLQ